MHVLHLIYLWNSSCYSSGKLLLFTCNKNKNWNFHAFLQSVCWSVFVVDILHNKHLWCQEEDATNKNQHRSQLTHIHTEFSFQLKTLFSKTSWMQSTRHNCNWKRYNSNRNRMLRFCLPQVLMNHLKASCFQSLHTRINRKVCTCLCYLWSTAQIHTKAKKENLPKDKINCTDRDLRVWRYE